MAEKVHMTRRGYERLREEVKRLKAEERPRLVEAIRRAREHGDVSENAEFEAAREQQAHVESRIRILEDRIARAEVVDPSAVPLDRVRFGLTVVLEDVQSGEELTYTLVGEDEVDVAQGLISVSSPVGRAVINREEGEEVTVRAPAGARRLEVRAIRRWG
jgi:transcription elongation factor GreA